MEPQFLKSLVLIILRDDWRTQSWVSGWDFGILNLCKITKLEILHVSPLGPFRKSPHLKNEQTPTRHPLCNQSFGRDFWLVARDRCGTTFNNRDYGY